MSARFETVRETGSTNADLIARLEAGENIAEGTWLVADRQTSGRGRQGRRWLDARGNFMGSTVVHLSPQDPPAPSLSFVTSLAVYEAVFATLARPLGVFLKWPNDVLIAGSKFCGILLERRGDYAVIGVGVNLAAAPRLADRETRSLADSGPVPGRDAFARELAHQFDRELGRWRQFGLGPLLTRWLSAAHPIGSALSVHDGKGQKTSGKFEGLAPDGALQLRLDDGTMHVIHAGDVELEGN